MTKAAPPFPTPSGPVADVRDFASQAELAEEPTAALQKAVDAAGTLNLPATSYAISRPLSIKNSVRIQGAGENQTQIWTAGDFTAVAFEGDVGHAVMDGVFVGGNLTADATAPLVTIADNLPIFMSNCRLWGGSWGLVISGNDCAFYNCFIMGAGKGGGGIYSHGANWYERVKMDTINTHMLASFVQGPPSDGASKENNLVNCDLVGDMDYSLIVDDPTGLAATSLFGCRFAEPIALNKGLMALILGCEIGSDSYNAFDTSVTGCYAFKGAPIKFTGPGHRVGAGNLHISL